MASVVVENISVTFPVYGAASRSLKNALIASTTGGRVTTDVKEHVTIQALTNLSFQINHGERVALIGHNGAGKSTVLRVINGIYEPQVGRVLVEGRTVPLFDTNLGMDLESTGYENILLRGMYLGFSRTEIRAKTQEIADFTELGSFLEMPAKTYSTGMVARLAFAISTSIEPDILLIDEGISAGDAAFLEKAKQRLEDLIERTRILILASHDEQLVRRWCNRAVLFEKGRCVSVGSVDEILRQYHSESASQLFSCDKYAKAEIAALNS